MWGQNSEAVIRYLMIVRDVMDLSSKRKFNGGGYRGYHGGHCKRSGGNGTRITEGKNHRNGAGLGGGKGGHSDGRDVNNSEGGGARGGNNNNNNNNNNPPPPTRTDR